LSVTSQIVKKLKAQVNSNLVLWAVFLATFLTTLISLVSVVFPALLLRSLGGFDDIIGINSFETGIWTFPFLAANLIILVLVVLYKKNFFSDVIKKFVNFIFKFEISLKVAFLVITILIGTYIVFSVNELFDQYYFPDYDIRVKDWIDNYTVTEVGNWGVGYHLNLFFLKSSVQIFENDKVIPFMASISLLVLTYFFTLEITKKRFAGIIAMVIVLQSGIFLMYDTSVSYPNFWIVFYLLSLYLISKKTLLSPISYLASLLSKFFTVAFLPMTLFFIYRTNFTRQKKIRILLYYGIALISFVGLVLATGTSLFLTELDETFEPKLTADKLNFHEFLAGFTAFYSSLRLDGLILVFILPCIIGLFFASRKRVLHADSIMFMILIMLLSAPFLVGSSDFINAPYRFVPLVVFFAIGVGVLLSNNISFNKPLQRNSNHQ